jgi:phosphoglycerate dehydrogenase-like enzyme
MKVQNLQSLSFKSFNLESHTPLIGITKAMRRVIIVHPLFDGSWPFVANHLHKLWPTSELIRLESTETRSIEQLIAQPETVTQLISLMASVTVSDVEALSSLEEAVIYTDPYGQQASQDYLEHLKMKGVKVYKHSSESYWGQSVAEFALALTLCALRQIPQGYHKMMTSLEPWNYKPKDGIGKPEQPGIQYCDTPHFTSGTLEGKRVRIVGAGNIGSRFASFSSFLGADVSTWDPYAPEPSFRARREQYLENLLENAEIFAPMLPLTESTRGLITAHHIQSLPKGCLVVLATRANICDFAALKERLLKDELSLAADVFDTEPLALNDPLIGRHNVIHTPHMAGRTKEANFRFAQMLIDRFLPYS